MSFQAFIDNIKAKGKSPVDFKKLAEKRIYRLWRT
jgi:hypothetical protein